MKNLQQALQKVTALHRSIRKESQRKSRAFLLMLQIRVQLERAADARKNEEVAERVLLGWCKNLMEATDEDLDRAKEAKDQLPENHPLLKDSTVWFYGINQETKEWLKRIEKNNLYYRAFGTPVGLKPVPISRTTSRDPESSPSPTRATRSSRNSMSSKIKKTVAPRRSPKN